MVYQALLNTQDSGVTSTSKMKKNIMVELKATGKPSHSTRKVWFRVIKRYTIYTAKGLAGLNPVGRWVEVEVFKLFSVYCPKLQSHFVALWSIVLQF